MVDDQGMVNKVRDPSWEDAGKILLKLHLT